MNDLDILAKAIDKATANGYQLLFSNRELILKRIPEQLPIQACYGIIFSHSFAKAFWGEEFIDEISIPPEEHFDAGLYAAYCDSNLKVWQYHLQQMVLEENPIEYLEKFL